MRGLSEAYGSWKIICTSSAASRAARRVRPRDVRALAQRIAPVARRHDAGDDAAERGLAAAGLADQADHLALGDGRGRRRRPRARPALAQLRAEHAGDAARRGRAARTKRLRDASSVDDRRHAGTSCRPRRRCGWKQRARAGRAASSASGGASLRRPRRRAGSAARNAQPGGRSQQATASCRGSARSGSPRWLRLGTRADQARACRDAAARSSTSSTVPCSTMRPAYITRDPVGEPGDHRRDRGVIQISAVPVSRARASAPRPGSAPGW